MMLNLADTVDAMVAADCTPQQIAAVVRAYEAQHEQVKIEQRERSRDVSEREWLQLRAVVLRRNGFACVYCGSAGEGETLHCDHVHPRSRGGKSTLDNLAAACKSCNSSKRDRTLDEWQGRPQ